MTHSPLRIEALRSLKNGEVSLARDVGDGFVTEFATFFDPDFELATRIANAVNAHDKLVAALEMALLYVFQAADDAGEAGQQATRDIDTIKAALAQQPQPKRECGTCKHYKNFAIRRYECSEPCLSCFGYDKYEAEAGA